MDNTLVFVKQLLYNLKKDYGFSLDIYRVVTSSVDVTTGVKTVQREKHRIRRAVVLPAILARKFSYDLSYIAANKNFTYGGFYDTNTRIFIVDQVDLPKGFNLTEDDYVVYDTQRYEIRQFEALEHRQGYLITAKQTVGKKPHQILAPKVSSTFAIGQKAVGVK